MLNTISNTETKEARGVYQLVKLSPASIEEDWEALSLAIDASLPPIADEKKEGRMNNVLQSILANELECWVFYIDNEPYILGTIAYIEEFITNTTNLLIYSLYSYKSISYKIWTQLLLKLQDIAKQNKCYKLFAYSDNERVINLVNTLDGKTETRLIEIIV